MAETLISVIIPVLNEAENLKRLLPFLLSSPAIEVLTVDGQSEDESYPLAQQYLQENALLSLVPNRAAQQNLGAKHAKGKYLLFLHADSILPLGWVEEILKHLQNKNVTAGAFRFKIDSSNPLFFFIEIGVWLRCLFKNLPYGDQGLFISKEKFLNLGCFPEVPIMEDLLLVQKILQGGRLSISRLPLYTSSRRWQKLGIMKTTIRNQKVLHYYKKTGNLDGLRELYQQGIK